MAEPNRPLTPHLDVAVHDTDGRHPKRRRLPLEMMLVYGDPPMPHMYKTSLQVCPLCSVRLLPGNGYYSCEIVTVCILCGTHSQKVKIESQK